MICYIAPDRLGDETENEEDRWHCNLSKVTQNVTQLWWLWLSKNHQTKMSQNFTKVPVPWSMVLACEQAFGCYFSPKQRACSQATIRKKSSSTQLPIKTAF